MISGVDSDEIDDRRARNDERMKRRHPYWDVEVILSIEGFLPLKAMIIASLSLITNHFDFFVSSTTTKSSPFS